MHVKENKTMQFSITFCFIITLMGDQVTSIVILKITILL